VHARRFLLSDFVSIGNKERLSYFPKLDVAGSIPVARSGMPALLTEVFWFIVKNIELVESSTEPPVSASKPITESLSRIKL
jgi:hypothetical protein